MPEKRFIPGKMFKPGQIESSESTRLGYTLGDEVELNDYGVEHFSRIMSAGFENDFRGRVLAIDATTTKFKNAQGETELVGNEYLKKITSKTFRPGKIRRGP